MGFYMQKNSLQDILFCSTFCKSSAEVLWLVLGIRKASWSQSKKNNFESMIYWERLKGLGSFNLKTD